MTSSDILTRRARAIAWTQAMLEAGFTEHSLRVRARLSTSANLPPGPLAAFERFERIIPPAWQPGQPVEGKI